MPDEFAVLIPASGTGVRIEQFNGGHALLARRVAGEYARPVDIDLEPVVLVNASVYQPDEHRSADLYLWYAANGLELGHPYNERATALAWHEGRSSTRIYGDAVITDEYVGRGELHGSNLIRALRASDLIPGAVAALDASRGGFDGQ
jgi:hypothetical protein